MDAEEMSERVKAVEISLDFHLKSCEKGNEAVTAALNELQSGQKALFARIDSAARRIHGRVDKILYSLGGTLILILLSIIGYMLANWGPWNG